MKLLAVKIGEFREVKLDAATDVESVERVFTSWLSTRGMDSKFVECRHGMAYPDRSAIEWHVDCDGATRFTLVWSTVHPTEIRHATTKRLFKVQPKPFEVWLIDNHYCEHRGPTVDELFREDRWLVVVRRIQAARAIERWFR